MVKVHKLWKKPSFYSLSCSSKLVFLFLCTSPRVNSLGLFTAPVRTIEAELNLTETEFRQSCKELVRSGLIKIYACQDPDPYFLVVGHYDTLPNSEVVRNKARKDIESSPKSVLKQMIGDKVMPDIKDDYKFTAPTEDEVFEYSLSQGVIIDAKEFISFYEENARRLNKKGWYDSRGKRVKDWKRKLKSVWANRAEKIPKVDDAPEGFEHFYVKDETGKVIFPKGWRNGSPYGEGLLQDKLLKSKYIELKENSL